MTCGSGSAAASCISARLTDRARGSACLTVNITVASGATTGARNVTVTNPDGGTGTGVFTVNAGPTVNSPTSSSPCNPVHNGTADCSITGTGFVSGVTVTISNNGSVNSVTFNSSTSLTITVTGSGGNGANHSRRHASARARTGYAVMPLRASPAPCRAPRSRPPAPAG
jgi:hypothetical protein